MYLFGMVLPIWIIPTNISEILTLQENIDKPLNEISYAYVGHGQSNIVMPLMSGAAKMGMDFRLIGPKQYWPAGPFYEECLKVAKETGATITCTDNVAEGVKGLGCNLYRCMGNYG